jgi:hypothetical protein
MLELTGFLKNYISFCTIKIAMVLCEIMSKHCWLQVALFLPLRASTSANLSVVAIMKKNAYFKELLETRSLYFQTEC